MELASGPSMKFGDFPSAYLKADKNGHGSAHGDHVSSLDELTMKTFTDAEFATRCAVG
jgi:hypothetical protein